MQSKVGMVGWSWRPLAKADFEKARERAWNLNDGD